MADAASPLDGWLAQIATEADAVLEQWIGGLTALLAQHHAYTLLGPMVGNPNKLMCTCGVELDANKPDASDRHKAMVVLPWVAEMADKEERRWGR